MLNNMVAYKPEPIEERYTGEVGHCELCKRRLELDNIWEAAGYAYVTGLGYVCNQTPECKKEFDLEELRRTA